ncbi:hypothetical protein B296_00034662 [Ensete ventricosum]|uniref:Uncharacterized protein n=1 Tax=Ensete ventricosum TaxID=4639 RepID=A0A426YT63_ENSVE|nr:hypothetical protein B296_00034662 [Ensete ventricosum]
MDGRMAELRREIQIQPEKAGRGIPYTRSAPSLEEALSNRDVVGEEVKIYMDEKWKVANKESRNSRSGDRRVVAAAAEEGGGPFLKRSASTREGRRRTTTMIKTSRSFTSRCASQVKEQRARLYIMRRCVTMLVCWRDSH